MRRAAAGIGALVLIALGFAVVPDGAAQGRGKVVVLRALDKVTARISTIEAPIEREIRFGTLRILARACRTRPPEEPPETTAFLEITDVRPGEPSVPLFTGWMFASSPALSALEHPVYDVWVIACKTAAPSDSEGSE